ncbi:YndJ family protein [Sporosarcina sp. GW1-11]|uniref:YndJ family protein n=1 Tax=Sporosarcina sp. GW1-11 TaxID=2899126 RepID=UPI00294E9B0A|nr:YndJ family protein [Sporosarcina sp. GW1-11]MDV6379268.1 YndJ family protein [Sporosarcina sp. GW1-11]
MRKFVIIHVLLFLVTLVFSDTPWPYGLLVVAQLVYIPVLLRLVCTERDWFWTYYPYVAVPAYASVVLGQVVSTAWDGWIASFYLLFTLYVALYGIARFLRRGFTNIEEFAIDLGLVYLAMGGGWYFAFVAGIDLGFSPLLTWLTAIHFHYSAFILPIFIGWIGRLHSSRVYRWAVAALLSAPMIVAVGITFSRWIEILSVLLYMYGFCVIIWIVWRSLFANRLQKWLLRLAFSALAVTITFSMFYVLSNGFGLFSVTIDFMLRFHGVLNCIVFALFGLIGWSISVPPARFVPPTFPRSQIRGRRVAEEIGQVGKHRGLSDDLTVYGLSSASVSPLIIRFYEQTTDFRLSASVHWHRWFKPFAFVYSFISQRMQQINLPLRSEIVEMTGAIYTLDEGLDGREQVRVWERKVGEQTIFTALYSQHETNERMYMNIALPLPYSTMTGVLELHAVNQGLRLTSKRTDLASDAGVYLSFDTKGLFTLPLQETFFIEQTGEGTLQATHHMWIFSLPFLTIDYLIVYEGEDR